MGGWLENLQDATPRVSGLSQVAPRGVVCPTTPMSSSLSKTLTIRPRAFFFLTET